MKLSIPAIIPILALTLAPAFAGASQLQPPLENALKNYVAAFDLSQLDEAARQELRTIVHDPDISHAGKVFEVHAILDAHDALIHLDMHGLTGNTSQQASR